MKSREPAIALLRRYFIFTISLFIMSLGVALTLRANMGSSAISVIPFVWSMTGGIETTIFGFTFTVPQLTLGQYTIGMNILLILIQILLLRRNYPKIQFLQLFTGLLFGFFLDFGMLLTQYFQWGSSTVDYLIRFIQMLIGGCVLAFGITCEVRTNTLVLPGEGFAIALSKVLRIDFGKAKIYADTGLVALGVVFCYLFFGAWQWNMVGIGTLVSMIFVGVMVRFFSCHMKWLDSILNQQVKTISEPSQTGTFPLVITIAREFGSGGHEIGKKLAHILGIEFYDRKIIDRTANELGLTPEFVEKSEQNISTGKLMELILTDKQVPTNMNLSEDETIFVTQSRIIRSIASEKSCVIVGRCADYVLKNRPKCFNVFVFSDIDFARARIMNEFNVSEEEAENMIHHKNKVRSNHYWQFTGQKWNDPGHYDLVINTSKLGIEGAVKVITEAVKS